LQKFSKMPDERAAYSASGSIEVLAACGFV